MEEELVRYCIHMDETYFGLRRRDIARMAFQLADHNKLKHSFASDARKAGKKWMRGFLKRHPQMAFRKPQSISVARVQSFTKENVALFFNVLKPEMEKIGFRPQRVFNCDETGITVVQHAPEKVSKLHLDPQYFFPLTPIMCIFTYCDLRPHLLTCMTDFLNFSRL